MRQPIIYSNITQTIVQTLGSEIVMGRFNGKEFLSEKEVSESFGAARTVTREAIKMLSAKGLLSSKQRQGTRIEPIENWNLLDADVLRWLMERPFSSKVFLEFAQMRLAIEPIAAALAAQVQDVTAIAAIREALDRMSAVSGQPKKSLQADIDFHVAILKASGNPFFWRLKPLINNALQLSIQLTNKISGHTASIEAHEAIISAIERGDEIAAEAASRAVLVDAQKLIEKASLTTKLRA